MQRQAAAVTQDRELVHIDVHTPLVPARQLRPRTQANDRDPHKMNDNVAGMGCRRPRKTARQAIRARSQWAAWRTSTSGWTSFPGSTERWDPMSDEQAAPETRGVTAELLATVDLGPEIEGMAGRELRMRVFTFEPGAVFGPIHDHKDRPGIVYILQGTITDHRDGVATNYGPGVGWPEDRNTMHWLENRGTVPAVEVSVDIVRSSQ